MWTSPDNKIHKLLITEGDWGLKPSENSECEVFISDCLQLEECNNTTIIIGDSDSYLRRTLDSCLITMNQSEEAKFTISPENISFTVKLVKVTSNGLIYQWDAKKKYELALSHKEKGVKLFKDNRDKDAAYRFVKGLKILSSIPIDAACPPDEIDSVSVADIEKLKSNLFNNLASYYLKHGALSTVVDLCKKVFIYDKDSVKAHYKIGVAYMKDRNFEEAEKEFNLVLDKEPQNKVANEYQRLVKDEIRKANDRVNNLFKKMFD